MQEVGKGIRTLPSPLLATAQPRFTPTFGRADGLSLCSRQPRFCTVEVKHGTAWLSHQGKSDGNEVKWSHLSLRPRSRHTGGTGMGSLYLGEVVEINYEYY